VHLDADNSDGDHQCDAQQRHENLVHSEPPSKRPTEAVTANTEHKQTDNPDDHLVTSIRFLNLQPRQGRSCSVAYLMAIEEHPRIFAALL
jgi:hypothetical protein